MRREFFTFQKCQDTLIYNNKITEKIMKDAMKLFFGSVLDELRDLFMKDVKTHYFNKFKRWYMRRKLRRKKRKRRRRR